MRPLVYGAAPLLAAAASQAVSPPPPLVYLNKQTGKAVTCHGGRVWKECGSSCEFTCAGKPICTDSCIPKCECPSDRPIFERGRCIHRDDCGKDLSTLCTGGKVFNECGSACTATCLDPEPICTRQCVARCECPKSNPIWDNEKCIKEAHCAQTHQTFHNLAETDASSVAGDSDDQSKNFFNKILSWLGFGEVDCCLTGPQGRPCENGLCESEKGVCRCKCRPGSFGDHCEIRMIEGRPYQVSTPMVPQQKNVNVPDDGKRIILSEPDPDIGLHAGWQVCQGCADFDESVSNISSDVLEAASRNYISQGLAEHASVASFGRFSLHLMRIGAPAAILRGAHEAAIDEIEHAQLCFSIGNWLSGAAVTTDGLKSSRIVGPRAFPFPDDIIRIEQSMRKLVLSVLDEGVMGETLATLRLALRSEHMKGYRFIQETLKKIMVDEARHASLGWRTLAWSVFREENENRNGNGDKNIRLIVRNWVSLQHEKLRGTAQQQALSKTNCTAGYLVNPLGVFPNSCHHMFKRDVALRVVLPGVLTLLEAKDWNDFVNKATSVVFESSSNDFLLSTPGMSALKSALRAWKPLSQGFCP